MKMQTLYLNLLGNTVTEKKENNLNVTYYFDHQNVNINLFAPAIITTTQWLVLVLCFCQVV